jgi:hypothetical protein
MTLLAVAHTVFSPALAARFHGFYVQQVGYHAPEIPFRGPRRSKGFSYAACAEKDQKPSEFPFIRAKQRRGFDIGIEMLYVPAWNPRFKQQPVQAVVKFFFNADPVGAPEAQ